MLSTKLIADYTEMINEFLDNIQISIPEDIQLLQADLHNILMPSVDYKNSQKYQETVSLIMDYLENPDSYVQHEINFEEFKQIIRTRIATKIEELTHLTPEQIAEIIQQHHFKQKKVSEFQSSIAGRIPPAEGSPSHVLTEQQMLAEMQQQFQIGNTPNFSFFTLGQNPIPPSAGLIDPFMLHMVRLLATHSPTQRAEPPPNQNLEQAIQQGIFSREQYMQMPPHIRDSMDYLISENGRAAFAAGMITFERYTQIPLNQRESMKYLFSANGRAAFAAGMINLQQYLDVPVAERKSMKYLFSANGRAAFAAGMIDLQQYLGVPVAERETLKYLFSANGRAAVAEGHIDLNQYLQIPAANRKTFLDALVQRSVQSNRI